MLRLRTVLSAFALCLFAAVAGSTAHASSITYDFDYSGSSLIGSSASGNGYFTYNSVTGALTDFYFTDVVTNSIFGKGTFVYDFQEVLTSSLILAGDGSLLAADITTDWVTGTKANGTNSNLGMVDFTFNYALGLALDATTGSKLGDGTVGTGSVRLALPAATPEPSSLMLLGTGILGIAGFVRRKVRA